MIIKEYSSSESQALRGLWPSAGRLMRHRKWHGSFRQSGVRIAGIRRGWGMTTRNGTTGRTPGTGETVRGRRGFGCSQLTQFPHFFILFNLWEYRCQQSLIIVQHSPEHSPKVRSRGAFISRSLIVPGLRKAWMARRLGLATLGRQQKGLTHDTVPSSTNMELIPIRRYVNPVHIIRSFSMFFHWGFRWSPCSTVPRGVCPVAEAQEDKRKGKGKGKADCCLWWGDGDGSDISLILFGAILMSGRYWCVSVRMEFPLLILTRNSWSTMR